jgi:hypothetical protein
MSITKRNKTKASKNTFVYLKNKAKMPGEYQCHPKIKSSKRGCFPAKIYSLFGGKTRKAAFKKTGCNTDRCIAEKAHLPSTTMAKYLRPKKPDNWKLKPNTWLDTNNIDEVMKQYEEAYSHFIYLGAVPIDFSAQDPYSDDEKKCLYSNFCKINLQELKKTGKTAIGAVFNLDPHFKNGSHWVALYIDLRRKECNFFDSYGMRPHPLIFHLMKSLTLQMPLKLNYNARRFQHENSECGMYSIYFLINMIEGVPFHKFVKKPVADSEMLKLRNWIFSD